MDNAPTEPTAEQSQPLVTALSQPVYDLTDPGRRQKTQELDARREELYRLHWQPGDERRHFEQHAQTDA